MKYTVLQNTQNFGGRKFLFYSGFTLAIEEFYKSIRGKIKLSVQLDKTVCKLLS